MESSIKITDGAITVDNVEQNQYKSSLYQAQIRQVITKTYPSAKVGNSMSDALFSIDSYGLEDGAKYDQTRVTWIDVPKGTTQAQVEAQLKQLPKARIYRVLSNEPILTDNQSNAIAAGLTTLDVIAERQQIINPETGEVVLHNGLPQYAANFFSVEGKADMDLRKTAEEAPMTLADTKVAVSA